MNKAELFFKENEVLIIEKKRCYSIKYNDIQIIEYDKPYLIVSTTIKKKYIISQSLKDFCIYLPDYFIQCNKSTCVNALYVTSFNRNDDGIFEMALNRKKIVVSRRRITIIKEKFLFVHRFYFKHIDKSLCEDSLLILN